MTRTVLVTGGSGYYGTVVADLFQARGDRVRIFDLEAPTDPTDAEVVLGDVRDRNALRAACDGVDVIMNNVARSNVDIVPTKGELIDNDEAFSQVLDTSGGVVTGSGSNVEIPPLLSAS